MSSPVPQNEVRRLEALRGYGVLDTPPESGFDGIAALAASICGTPIALVSLVDEKRQWFKAKVGLTASETARDISLCAHAILQHDLFVVPDARADGRFAANPLVTAEPNIRFYAGAPLISPEGHALGTLCVIDHVARALTSQQEDALRVLSAEVVAQLELRRTKAELARVTDKNETASETIRAAQEFNSRLLACSRDCIKVLDLEGRLLYMNEGGMQVLEICDLGPLLNHAWIDFWEGEDREAARAAVETAKAGGIGRFVGYFEPRITRQPRWWDVVVSSIRDAQGRPERLLALSRDVTELRQHEQALRDAHQLSREIIEGAAEGIIVYDSELRYQVFNPFMQRLTGRSFEEVSGKIAAEVFPRLRTSGLEEKLKQALQGEVIHVQDVFVAKHSAGGRDVWESCTFAPHRDAQDKIIGVVGLVHDTTERHLAEETFKSIVIGTAAATGSDFFPSLVRHLASALQVRFAFVSDCADQKHAKVLAVWKGDNFGENFEFDIADTPCMKVLNGEICHYRNDLQGLFPLDTGLAEWGAESYLGVPMLDSSSRVIGHIAILDDKPMERDPRAIDLVKIFAARAAAELKRQRAESGLQAALARVQHLERRNRTLLDITNAMITSLKREDLLHSICGVLKDVANFDFAGLAIYDAEAQDLRIFALEGGFLPDQLKIGQLIDCEGRQSGQRWDFTQPVLRNDLKKERQYTFEQGLYGAGIHSQCAVPLVVQGKAIGVMGFGSRNVGAYTQDDLSFFQEVANQIAMSVANMQAYEEIAALKIRLQAENVYLQEEISKEHNFEEIVGNSRALVEVLRNVETVAPTDSTVLILGETGCGKELIARAVHNRSARKHRPLVKLNCGAIPTGLVESELFGHMKGAFTGALERRVGRFELADGGTLFLDEISELPLETQVKLLRVLQEHEFEPLGSSRTVRVNVRIIAASNRDLDKAIQEGRFRADLYYRLNVLPMILPPLRQRRSDVPLLASFFVERFARQFGKHITGIAHDTMDILSRYDWPGNIRELQNVIERAVVLSRGSVLKLGPDLLPANDWEPSLTDKAAAELPANGHETGENLATYPSLEEVEKRHIIEVLKQTEWVIEGQGGAAKILDLHPNTLRSRMKKLGLERSSPKDLSAPRNFVATKPPSAPATRDRGSAQN